MIDLAAARRAEKKLRPEKEIQCWFSCSFARRRWRRKIRCRGTFEEGSGGAWLLFALGNLHSGGWRRKRARSHTMLAEKLQFEPAAQEESLLITRSLAPAKRFDKFTLFLLARTHIPHSQPGVFIFATRMPALILFSLFCCVQTFRGIRGKKTCPSSYSLLLAMTIGVPPFCFFWCSLCSRSRFCAGRKRWRRDHVQKMGFAHTAHGEWSKGSERKN